jgi:dienelactone hydrolase
MADNSLSYKTFFEHETSRMIFEGALACDIRKVFSNTETENDWISQWAKLGESEEKKAKLDKQRGFIKTAYSGYLRASNYYRLAQYHLLKDSEDKKRLLKKSIKLYDEVVSLSQGSIKIITITYQGVEIKGYIHLPKRETKVPCIICIPGLGHNKESMHQWCQYGVKRGMAVFIADGPGYGETRVFDNIALDFQGFNQYIQTAIDALSDIEIIDCSKIGVLGDCFGGYLAFRALVEEERIKSCAIVEGILEYGETQIKDKPLPELITYHLEKNELEYFNKMGEVFFESNIDRNVSLYILHSKTDKLIPVSIAKKIYDYLEIEKHLEIVDGEPIYNNYLNNHYNKVLDELFRYLPSVWDWLYDKLNSF